MVDSPSPATQPATTSTLRELTILVPALNEEGAIEQTVGELLPVVREHLDRAELYLVNDGSSDRTGELMEALAASNPEVRVLHHDRPLGVGCSFQEVLARATCPYVTVIPGDRAYSISSLRQVFKVVGAADLVVTYRTNQLQSRRLHRVVLSLAYKRLMAALFSHDLLDYHSVTVYPVSIMRGLRHESTGYAYQLETLVQLIEQGVSIVQVPVNLNLEAAGSRSLRAKTFVDVARAAWRLRR